MLKEFNSLIQVQDVGIEFRDIVCTDFWRRNMDAATGREGDGVIRAVARQRAQGAVTATTILELPHMSCSKLLKVRTINEWMALRRFGYDIMVGV